jgi:hypothetical protein
MVTSNTGFRSVRDAYIFSHYVFESDREYKVVVKTKGVQTKLL